MSLENKVILFKVNTGNFIVIGVGRVQYDYQ